MFRSFTLAFAALAASLSGKVAVPLAQAEIQLGMPDYIVSMNRQNTIVGSWSLTTRDGNTTANYHADGTIEGFVTPTGSNQKLPFFGYYSLVPLGGERFELKTTLPMPRGRKPLVQTDRYRFQPDGNIQSETSGVIAYRLR